MATRKTICKTSTAKVVRNKNGTTSTFTKVGGKYKKTGGSTRSRSKK